MPPFGGKAPTTPKAPPVPSKAPATPAARAAVPPRAPAAPAPATPRPAAPAASAAQQPNVKAAPAHVETGSDPIRSAQLRFYEAGAAYYTAALRTLGDKQPAAVGKATPGPTGVGTTSSAPPAPKAAAPTSVPPSPPKAPPVSKPSAAAPKPSAPAATGGLADKPRKELVEIARSMGLDPTGKKAEDLRLLIEGGGEGAAPAPAASEEAGIHEDRAKSVMQLIEDNLELYESVIDPESTEEGALKCGGDCLRCPNPEGHPSAAAQVDACYVAMHEAHEREMEWPVN